MQCMPGCLLAGPVSTCTCNGLPASLGYGIRLPEANIFLLCCRSIVTDGHLQVKGSNGSIYALGDAATIDQPKAVVRAKVGISSIHTGLLKARVQR